jgi:hypothetical protein
MGNNFEVKISLMIRFHKPKNGFSKPPDFLQVLSYILVSGTTAAVYGIVIFNYASLIVKIMVGSIYCLLFGAVVINGCKLTFDDPTELNTIKTKYYRDVLK